MLPMDSTVDKVLAMVPQVSPTGLLQIFSAFVLVTWVWNYWQNRLRVPVFGGPLRFSRTLALLRLAKRGREEFLRAYAEDPMILVPRLDAWALLTHSKYIDELSRAPDDVLSFMAAGTNVVQFRYTFGPRIADDHYHLNVIRNQLTRNLSSLFPEVLDETQLAISELVRGGENAWDTSNVFSFAQQVVTRASNRIFVGVPLCRNKAWLSLNVTAAMDTMRVAFLINMFPTGLQPIIGRLLSPAHRRVVTATKLAGPYVKERLAQAESERPNDFLSWVISSAPPHECNPEDLTNRLLATNFAAIHTTSMNVTHALYWLLARPEYIKALRTEIEEVTEKLGWTKEAIGAMPILDSFMKECMRLTPVGAQVMSRKTLKPFTFSNGLQVPTGTVISTHLYATHLDEKHYTDASSFDGFRFVETPQAEEGKPEQDDLKKGTARSKKTMYTTSPTYLSFGHGRHACPGRFFASMEVKLILAHLLFNYDMKWPEEVYREATADGTKRGEDGSYRPPDIWFANVIVPNRSAKMLIRKRALF